MSFVISQHCGPCMTGGGPVYYREPVVGEDGKEDYAFVNQAKDLPSMSDFRLKNMLENGTGLERVNTKMLAPKEFDLNAFDIPKEEQTNKQEQINEQEQTNKQEQTNQQTKGE